MPEPVCTLFVAVGVVFELQELWKVTATTNNSRNEIAVRSRISPRVGELLAEDLQQLGLYAQVESERRCSANSSLHPTGRS